MKRFISIILISVLVLSSCSFRKEAAPSASLSNKITIWNLFDDSDVFEWQIQAFKSANPWVEIVYKKFSNIDNYEDLLLNEIAEWKWPDIFTVKNTWIEKYKWKLEPLYVWGTKTPMNEQIFKETFLPVAAKDLIIDWKIYWIPMFIDTLALYYNKQILWDAFTEWKPAETWEKFSTQVEQLSKPNNSVEWFSLAWTAMWRSDNIVRALDIFYLLMLQYWALFYDSQLQKIVFADIQWRVPWTWENNEPAKFALDFYTSFWRSSYKNYSWNDRITARYDESSEVYPFIQWKVAMIFWYSYLYNDIKSLISQFRNSNKETININDIAISETPQIQPFSESSKRDSLASYFPLVVSRNTENPALAWDFLLYLSSKESLSDYNERTHKPSSRIDLLDDQKIDPVYWVFARQASYSKSYPDKVVDDKKYNIVFNEIIDKVVKNKKMPEQSLIDGQRIIQCLLDKETKEEMIDEKCVE